MKSLMQVALGDDWQQLPPALQAHYQAGGSVDRGEMAIEYPDWMQPYLNFLRLLGALVNKRGKPVITVVEKRDEGQRQRWQRRMTYPDGSVLRFDSSWEMSRNGQITEYVNPVFGLRMKPYVEQGKLRYDGVCFVVRLGPIRLPLPEWLLLGHTTIVEQGIDEVRFHMDFRLTHPLFRQIFRYTGEFETAKL